VFLTEHILSRRAFAKYANMFITAILCVFIGLLTVYFWILKSRYTYFVRRNIPGPPPQFFFGHLLQLWKAPLSFLQIKEWTRQYGSIYGIFEGTYPVYIVSDPEFLQEVYIKQFSLFHSRRANFLSRIHLSKGTHLFAAHGDEWRRQRHVINPTFTAAKLKTMTPLMNECIHSMMVKVGEMNGDEFNIYALYKRLSMDIICKKD
jgi:cytochrome P450